MAPAPRRVAYPFKAAASEGKAALFSKRRLLKKLFQQGRNERGPRGVLYLSTLSGSSD
jgi:hypothetical protein